MSARHAPTAAIREALLRWYDTHARELPWRRTRDPYAIWVSEIMLQQTRVDTVLRYYDRFLECFPDPHALAAADEDEVMARWSGLGYYRRARLLHRGVREVVARYQGRVPQDAEARRALPGVGRYTAGAIGSIAFDRPEPIVDGNVARVLARLHVIEAPPQRAATQRRLWEEAEALARGPRPGALNQALMELGALVCVKGTPACGRCPLQTYCRAYAQGRVEELPPPKPRKAPKPVKLAVVTAFAGRGAERAVALVRARGSLFGGLWNLPSFEGHGRQAARRALAEAGLRATLDYEPADRHEHVLSHRRLLAERWHASGAKLEAGGSSDVRLVPLSELGSLGISALTHKLLQEA